MIGYAHVTLPAAVELPISGPVNIEALLLQRFVGLSADYSTVPIPLRSTTTLEDHTRQPGHSCCHRILMLLMQGSQWG